MKKVKYYFNTTNLRYEKLETPLRVKLLRTFGFLATLLVTSAVIAYIAMRFIDSPEEKLLRLQNEQLQNNYSDIKDDIKKLELQMRELENRDNNVYRSIFEATPIPDSARSKEQEIEQELAQTAAMSTKEITGNIHNTLLILKNRIATQNKSFDKIEALVKDKETLLSHTPAIQPVSNEDLTRIASGFGYRIDPIYKTTKLHAGVDFTAPSGTPIYATADGTIAVAGNTGNGYGNYVKINHGYGYETLYGHMAKVKARTGQKVKRGEVIGWVGNSGKSTGPHCHYEVIKNGNKIDPVYFFYNDLTPEQFDRILQQAASSNQSLD